MKTRPFILASFALNCVFAAVLYNLVQRLPDRDPQPLPVPPSAAPPPKEHTNVIVRRQNFTWDEIESDDYRTYIANLRNIGCPERTVRDIIVADVNQLFARRRSSEVVTPDQHWWKSDPETELTDRAQAKERQLDKERRDLLTSLLGPDWEESQRNPTSPGLALNGPILGQLPEETKERVREIQSALDEKKRIANDNAKRSGQPADPAELVRLEQDARNQLTQILNPNQLEEFLLRYSATASHLRQMLRGMDSSPDEFRRMFRAIDSLDPQLRSLAGSSDPAKQKQYADLLKQEESALRTVLPPDRFQSFEVRQNPNFQEVQEVAKSSGIPETSMVRVFQINQVTDRERLRVLNNRSLSEQEKDEAIRAIDEEEARALRTLLGNDVYSRYELHRNSRQINRAIQSLEKPNP